MNAIQQINCDEFFNFLNKFVTVSSMFETPEFIAEQIQEKLHRHTGVNESVQMREDDRMKQLVIEKLSAGESVGSLIRTWMAYYSFA